MSIDLSKLTKMNKKDNSGFSSKMKALSDLVQNSRNIVFFWGAWVSTESWVPDFRSKDWLYNQHDIQFDHYQPEYLLSHSCLYNESQVFFEYYRQKLDCRGIKPNITHYKLAEMEKAGKLLAVITQNIDGLHQSAWSKNVIELHGTTQRVYCDTCNKNYNSDFLFTDKRAIPFCTCGGIVRPDVTLYEESLPSDAWNSAMQAIAKADLFIIGWTSLTVYPANTLVQFFHWKHLVIINKDPTPQDQFAELVFHESLGKVFEKIKIE